MQLHDYPRPPMDTGRGLHGPHSPNPYRFLSEWDTYWRDQLVSMGIKWVKLMDDGTGVAGDGFDMVCKLIEADIMPVVRFYRQTPNPGVIGGAQMEYAEKLISVGAVYIETNNEPDLALEWEDRHRPENWLEIVVDQYIYEASHINVMGGFCLFPAFGPGGTTGENPFQMIVDKGRADLFDRMVVAVHNYCLGRPVDFPDDAVNQLGEPLTQEQHDNTAWDKYVDGPKWAWDGWGVDQINEARDKFKNPGQTILENSTCYRAYEYFDYLVNKACGHSVPTMMTEGGYNTGQRAGTTAGDDPRYPKPSPQMCADYMIEMNHALYEEPWAKDYHFANMAWLVGVQAVGNIWPPFEEQCTWFGWKHKDDFEGCDGEYPIVQMMKDDKPVIRQDGPTPPGWNDPDPELPPGGVMTMFDEMKATLLANPGNHTPEEFGIKIVPNNQVAEGETYFKCVGIVKVECSDNNQGHYWWMEVVDEEDNRLMGSKVDWNWEGNTGDVPSPVVVDKPPNECANLTMWAHGSYYGWVDSYIDGGQDVMLGSDRIDHVNGNRTDEQEGCSLYHHSFYSLWKRTTKGDEPEPPIDPEPPLPGECDCDFEAIITKLHEQEAALEGVLDEVRQCISLLQDCEQANTELE